MDLMQLAKEKGIDIEKFRLSNNRIATISESSSGDDTSLPYGKLRSGSGFVKFGKLIMPELTFRDADTYPYLTAFTLETGDIFLQLVCETKEKPKVVSDNKVLFADTVEKRVHVCFMANVTYKNEEQQEVTFEEDKWYFCSPEDEILGEFHYYCGEKFYYILGSVAFDYDVTTLEGEVLREKDSIESLQNMDYMFLFPLTDEIETGLLKNCAKVGDYIEAPTEGIVSYGLLANAEYYFPSDDLNIEVSDTEGKISWELSYTNEDSGILALGNDAAAQEFDVSETGIYANYMLSLLTTPMYLIIPSKTTDYLVKSNTISNIANSIRDKLGTSAKMLLEDMPNAIKSIATVGDSITITWDGQPTETVFDSRYYKVSDLYFNGTQLINATVTLTNGTEEVTGKYTDSRWNKLGLKTGDKGVAWGLELGLFSTDGTNTDLGASKGTYIGVLASGDYSGYWVSSITYPVTPDVLLQEKTITANGTYSADEGYNGISKVVVDVPTSSGSSQTIVTTDSVTITNADVTVEDESTIVLGG